MKRLVPLVTFIAVGSFASALAQTVVAPTGPTVTTPPSATPQGAAPTGPTATTPPGASTGSGGASGTGSASTSTSTSGFNSSHPGGPSGPGTVYPNYTRPGGSVGGTNG